MPNPKSGTVTPDVAAAVSEFKKGKLAFRVDKVGSIHVAIGKADFTVDKIEENFKAFMDQIVRLKPAASKDRKSARLNSSHANISYAVFCLKKKNHLCRYLNCSFSHF